MKRKGKSAFNPAGILATLLLAGTSLYTPKLSARAESSEADGVIVALDVNSEWDGGYVANVTITNNTDSELVNWKLSVDGVIEVSNIWNATLEENGTLILPCFYNTNVPANGSVSFGYQGVGARTEVGFTCLYDGMNGTGEQNNEETETEENNPEETNPEENNPEETDPEVQINTVSGMIRNQNAAAVANVEVVAVRLYDAMPAASDAVKDVAKTDENGAFELQLPQGTYRLMIDADNYERKEVEITVKDEGVNALGEIIINEMKSVIDLVVKDADTDLPVKDTEVIFRSGWDAHKTAVILREVSDEEGRVVAELPEGNYTVELNRNGFKSSYANVVSGVYGEVQEVTIESMSHTFRGDIYEEFADPKGVHYPARRARVTFYSMTSGELVAETKADENGHYEIRLPYDIYSAVYDEDNHKRVYVDNISGDAFEGGQYSYQLDLEPVYLEYIYPMGTVSGSVIDTKGQLVGFKQARPLIKFNRIGLAGNEPVQAPDYHLYAELNERHVDGTVGDGTYHIELPVGVYQIWVSPADSGCDTALSQIIEVKEGEVTKVPDIVLDREQKIFDFPYYYNAHIQVIDIVTGKPIRNAKTCVMFSGSDIYSGIGIIKDPEYMYTDWNGELEFSYRGAGIKMAVYAEGYKDRSFNVCASVSGENVYYCAMIPETEPDPVWVSE